MGNLAVPEGYKDQMHATKGVNAYSGNFTTNNVTDPVASVTAGSGFVVTRTGVGIFLVTFRRSFRLALTPWAGCISASRIAQVTAVTPGTLRTGATMTIQVQNVLGTAVETTGQVVVFGCEFQLVTDHKGK